MSAHTNTGSTHTGLESQARAILAARQNAKAPSAATWLVPALAYGAAGIAGLLIGVLGVVRGAQELLGQVLFGQELQPENFMISMLLLAASVGLLLLARSGLPTALLARYQQRDAEAFPAGREMLDSLLRQRPELAPVVEAHCSHGHPLLMVDVHHLAVIAGVRLADTTAG